MSAANTVGVSAYSEMFDFTTLPPLPTAITASATNVGATTATLHGLVTANNGATIVVFAYGTTTSYGDTITAAESPVTGGFPVLVSANLTGLLPGTVYHNKVIATNSGGTTTGADVTFTTLPLVAFDTTASSGDESITPTYLAVTLRYDLPVNH